MPHVGALAADFRTSSMPMRDRLFLEKERLGAFIDSMPGDAPLLEMVSLCTCNRIELYYVCENHEKAAEWLGGFLAGFHGIPIAVIKGALINYRCAEAVRHLFRVAAGMESMVFGEHEILGQIREAYFHCYKERTTDSYLNRLFQQAIATGKQVRSRTISGRGALSIASIAVERMEEIAGNLREKRIMIVGIGAMGLRALKRLAGSNPREIGLSNRTNERALRFCASFNANHVPFGTIARELGRYDIVLLATSSRQYILNAGDIGSRSEPLLVIDLGAPRNADPAIGAMGSVTLVSVDDLRATAEARMRCRKDELAEMENIIERQVEEFTRWYRHRNGRECDKN